MDILDNRISVKLTVRFKMSVSPVAQTSKLMMLSEVWGASGSEWGLTVEPSFDPEGLFALFLPCRK